MNAPLAPCPSAPQPPAAAQPDLAAIKRARDAQRLEVAGIR